MKTQTVLAKVWGERHRQESLRRAGKFPHTCASNELSPEAKFVILAEEVGEVAREVAEMSNAPSIPRPNLKTELVQVAAVAVAWLESMEE